MVLLADEEDFSLDFLLVLVVGELFVEVDSFNDEFLGLFFDNYQLTDIDLNLTDSYPLVLDPESIKLL